jgi:uncharacterized protein (DUF1330 family)
MMCPSARRSSPTELFDRLEFGVVSLGFVKLVLEGDDAARGVDGGALIDQFPDAPGDAQLMARVTPMPAGGTLWCDHAGLVEAAQKTLGGTEHLDGPETPLEQKSRAAESAARDFCVTDVFPQTRSDGKPLSSNASAPTSQSNTPTAKGYVVFDLEIHDTEKYESYRLDGQASIRRFGGRVLSGEPAPRGVVEVLEGQWPTRRLVIVEFPTIDIARAWFGSDLYQAAVRVRRASSTGRGAFTDQPSRLLSRVRGGDPACTGLAG